MSGPDHHRELESYNDDMRERQEMFEMPWSILDDFADWQPSLMRACDCGSFNVKRALVGKNCVVCTKYVCDDCGADWIEEISE